MSPFRPDADRPVQTLPLCLLIEVNRTRCARSAFAYCTDLEERARLAGAVHAMKFEVDRVTGENFDGVGLTNDITRNLGRLMKGRRVALLGAGGAARGVVLPFLEQRPAELVIVNRTATKAEEIGRQFKQYGPITAIGY